MTITLVRTSPSGPDVELDIPEVPVAPTYDGDGTGIYGVEHIYAVREGLAAGTFTVSLPTVVGGVNPDNVVADPANTLLLTINLVASEDSGSSEGFSGIYQATFEAKGTGWTFVGQTDLADPANSIFTVSDVAGVPTLTMSNTIVPGDANVRYMLDIEMVAMAATT